jgi:hypothetical protein
MTEYTRVFAIYRSDQLVELAVYRLTEIGIEPQNIMVLHPDNSKSREFAQRKGTSVPNAVLSGTTSALPLDGTRGFWDPAAGPREGALPSALDEMGVAPEWCDKRVVHGDLLISVMANAEQAETVAEIYRQTGAVDLDSISVPGNE